ncbi:M48 family metalloprotease [Ramlibacter albus]|uniref:M48 family metalloprotease n=1 Tax=Ramlibacter albus TaxID=2079448 RepID=A0A923M7J3_9BURK|nr:M48 family metalloprotease [Ramlibacter albus]MBC5765288.1 M48 family metalloprotease [Ramlibacter albus]
MSRTTITLRAAACAALLAAAALPASAQFGGLLRNLPVPIPGVSAPAAAPAGGGDLIQMLQQSLESIDEPKEIEIGRQLAAVLLGSKPLHADMGLQRYVNELGRWISLHSTRPTLPWSFAVIDDPGFNAFAAPGGYIFVTKGLVDRVDEAELAGILAHEITHVVDKHHLQALKSKAAAGFGATLVGSQLRGDARGLVQSQVLSLIRNIYTSGLDKGDEFDADRHGVALAARAGFDPYGLPGVLQQLRTVPQDNPLFTLTLATHPPADQRLDNLEQAMGKRLDAFAGKPSVSIMQRVQAR